MAQDSWATEAIPMNGPLAARMISWLCTTKLFNLHHGLGVCLKTQPLAEAILEPQLHPHHLHLHHLHQPQLLHHQRDVAHPNGPRMIGVMMKITMPNAPGMEVLAVEIQCLDGTITVTHVHVWTLMPPLNPPAKTFGNQRNATESRTREGATKRNQRRIAKLLAAFAKTEHDKDWNITDFLACNCMLIVGFGVVMEAGFSAL